MRKEDFTFSTQVAVKLANPSPTDHIWNHITFFEQKLDEQNRRSLESTTNKRYVEIVKTENENPDCIILDIYTEIELGVPGRAFTGFSRSLVPQKRDQNNREEFDLFFEENLFHGKLLVFEKVLDQEKEEIEISNEEMLQALLHISFLPQSTLPDGKKKALKQIKNIMINSGIYTNRKNVEE